MDWQILDSRGEAMAVTEEQLRGMLRLGHLKRGTLMWCEGMADWAPAEEARPDLFPALHRITPFEAPGHEPMVVVPPQPVSAPPPRGKRGRPAASRRTPAARKSGGLVKWTFLLLLVVVAVVAVKIYTKPKPPGYDALAKAGESLSGAKTRGSGDTPREKMAAETMAEIAQDLRESGIEKGGGNFGKGRINMMRKAAAALDADGFTAYCTVRGDTAVFLLHVPDLRKFTDDAKDSMGRMAWFAANMALIQFPDPRPRRVCVGLKGIALYDRALEGPGAIPAVNLMEEISHEKLGVGLTNTITGAEEA